MSHLFVAFKYVRYEIEVAFLMTMASGLSANLNVDLRPTSDMPQRRNLR